MDHCSRLGQSTGDLSGERQVATGSPAGGRKLRILCITSLFPSSASPRHGVFVETRIRKLCAGRPAEATVVAPVPWFPSRSARFGRYARFAATPRREVRHALTVFHPRYLMIPRIGMMLQPIAMAYAVLRELRRNALGGDSFDVVDAHYFYPDGVAAAHVARTLGLPLVITARGSDVNTIAQIRGPRRAILRVAEQADSVIAVSEALRRSICDMGVDPEKTLVLRNGVDTTVFRPSERESTRIRLGAGSEPLVVSVGNLVPEKGHDLIVAAIARLPTARLVILGDGPERRALEALAQRLGVSARVAFVANMSQRELASFYSAADILALGSTREGWPNVLLEAMACGTPVVATDVGGVREIIRNEVAGRIVSERAPDAMAAAIGELLESPRREPERISYAAAFEWESVVARYFDVLRVAAGYGMVHSTDGRQ